MKIVIAPDSFKGTMTSIEVCNLIERGMKSACPDLEAVCIPIADGGEGTVNAYLTAIGGDMIPAEVIGPLGDKVNSFYGILPDETAVIEMAAASGLHLVGDNKRVLDTTTYGTGELLLHALDNGCRRIIMGIGGSATNDGGIGMAEALGVRFTAEDGNQIPLSGGGLEYLSNIDVSGIDSRIRDIELIIASDVNNPLLGKQGASFVFGPQKGATPEIVNQLENNLARYANILKQTVGADVAELPGAGAAGGLGAGLIAFCGAKIESGISLILDAVNFEELIKDADYIITGEGKIDGQSLMGKVPIGVAARSGQVPVIAIVGDIGDDLGNIYQAGITAVFSTNRRPLPFSEVMHRCREDLERTAENIMRLIFVHLPH